MNVTIVRSWCVLAHGDRWPYVLLPMCWLAGRIPATRARGRRLGLVTLSQMTWSPLSKTPVLARVCPKCRRFSPLRSSLIELESTPPALELRKRMHMGHLLAFHAE